MPLYRAMKRGAVEPLLTYLRGGGDPNLRYREHGSTLLHAAAGRGTLELVEALLAAGADIDALQVQGFTPLASAAHGGHLKCMRRLLAAGASASCRPLGTGLLESLVYARVKSQTVRSLLSGLGGEPADQPGAAEQ